MTLADEVVQSRLWKKIEGNEELAEAIRQLRNISSKLGAEAARVMPDYTDHSIKHMDALWWVSDQVLTGDESDRFTTAEAFVLGASFYIHDIGMALAATTAGVERIKQSGEYSERYSELSNIDQDNVRQVLAIKLASRDIHAKVIPQLVDEKLDGIDRYLIENSDIRRDWGGFIADVSASHHWDMKDVHEKLGLRGVVLSPHRDAINLGYLSCVLRVVDYAHINHERASVLDRALRSEISEVSAVHWDAQSLITGPLREGGQLSYGSLRPIDNIDAWWLYYEMAQGLDAEIKEVSDYLSDQRSAVGRFSLEGVKGVYSARQFVRCVRLAGNVVPIDVQVQPDSMDRLVGILGGRALYGNDKMAPIRELIQNSVDAIELRRKVLGIRGRDDLIGKISVHYVQNESEGMLTILDNGIGMGRSVLTRYLVGVASDYWNSAEFAREYGEARDRGFTPIGRFGIGFLSVFMLGDSVEVETTKGDGIVYALSMRGVGRRGELKERGEHREAGTRVCVRATKHLEELRDSLDKIVRARAPMISEDIEVRREIDGEVFETQIKSGWWKHAERERIRQFAMDWYDNAMMLGHAKHTQNGMRYLRGVEGPSGWPGDCPELITEAERIISHGGRVPGVVRCSKGMAVDLINDDDLFGLIDVGDMDLDAARHGIISRDDHPSVPGNDYDTRETIARLRSIIKPDVLAKVNGLGRYGMLPMRLRFLRMIAGNYGTEVFDTVELPWVPMVEPPGNVMQRSRKYAVERVKSENSVFCGVGLSADAAYSLLSRGYDSDTAGDMLLMTTTVHEFEVNFQARGGLERKYEAKIARGKLLDLLEEAGRSLHELLLLKSMLNIVCDAWNVEFDVLSSAEWVMSFEKYDRNSLCAVLNRGSQ